MKLLLSVLLAIALPALAGDVLEKPVTGTGTSSTVNVTFTYPLGQIEDIFLMHGTAVIQTGTVYIVNSTLGFTNVIGSWVFTNQSLNRLTKAYPVQQGDIVRAVFDFSANGVTHSVFVWPKNVQR